MRKLTENQVLALRDIQAGKVRRKVIKYGAVRIDCPREPRVVGKVIALRLAKWDIDPTDRVVAILTEAGEKVLSDVG